MQEVYRSEVQKKTSGFRVDLLEIHTCCIHYRPSIRMVQSITSAIRSFLLHET